jgi:CheY-like chemotaxis protein
VAADGETAVSLAQQLRPDVIVLDHELPVMDGLSAMPALHSAAPGVRIVLFSASTDDATKAMAFARGAAAYLVKDDCDFSEVLSTLRSAGHKHRLTA